jgi:hypothetical protein
MRLAAKAPSRSRPVSSTLGVIQSPHIAMRIRRLHLLSALTLLTPVAGDAACNIVNGKAYGDCQNVTVRQGTGQALDVRSHVIESAIIAGATIHSGGSLHLSGISNGDILVKRGGQLSVTGVVNATVRNEGGTVEIEGIVSNFVSNGGHASVGGQVGSFSGKGPATFKKGAVLQGTPLERVLRLPRTEHPAAARTQ